MTAAAHDPVIARPGRRRQPRIVAAIDLSDGVQLRFVVNLRRPGRSVRLQLFQRTASGYQPTTRKLEIPAHQAGVFRQALDESMRVLHADARAASPIHRPKERTP